MPVPYNITSLFNNTTIDIPSIIITVNSASNDLLSIGLLIAIFVIIYVLSLKGEGDNAIVPVAIASMFTSVIAIFLALGDMLSGDLVPIPIVICIVAVAIMYWGRGTQTSY